MLKAKSPIIKWAKRAGLFMFALVFALNVQVMFNQDSQSSNGSVSLMGMELNLFKSAAAEVIVGDGRCRDLNSGCSEWTTVLFCDQFLNTSGGYTKCYYFMIHG